MNPLSDTNLFSKINLENRTKERKIQLQESPTLQVVRLTRYRTKFPSSINSLTVPLLHCVPLSRWALCCGGGGKRERSQRIDCLPSHPDTPTRTDADWVLYEETAAVSAIKSSKSLKTFLSEFSCPGPGGVRWLRKQSNSDSNLHSAPCLPRPGNSHPAET